MSVDNTLIDTSFEVQKKPPVAEIEVRVVAVLAHVLKQLRV